MPSSMHTLLPSPWREWVIDQAARMGLPGADDFIMLLIRLEWQRQELEPFARQAALEKPPA